MEQNASNSYPGDLARFSGQASRWWDKKGPLQALHDINPLRVGYISSKSPIKGKKILDVGCGGGILSEALAAGGGRVKGIDLSGEVLLAAKEHALHSGLGIDYCRISVSELARSQPGEFDIVTCMEMLEHVPEPFRIVAACAALVKPGGFAFFSTINRTFAARILVILAAERLLGIAEKGTHEYKRFVRPQELAGWGRDAGLCLAGYSGFMYMPFVRKSWLARSMQMNYIMHFTRLMGP